MNRLSEIERFFSFIKVLIKNNPGLVVDECFIYSLLVNYDVGDDIYDVKDFFNGWCNYFRCFPNINVYFSASQRRFLQFENTNYYSAEFVKLYVTFNSQNLDECVKRIFIFLSANNIEHHSKVADCMRSDLVVLRIRKPGDVSKVIDFINRDSFLVNNARKTNPFLVREGIVGVAFDDKLSYNELLSFLLSQFIRTCISENKEINFLEFKEFVHAYLNVGFHDNKFLTDFLQTDYAISNSRRIAEMYDNENCIGFFLANVRSVLELISYSLEGKMDLKSVLLMYEDSINDDTKRFKELSFSNLVQGYSLPFFKKLFDDFIYYVYEKYGNTEKVMFAIDGFMQGNVKYITRDNGFRSKFSSCLDCQVINEITGNNIHKYVTDLLAEYVKIRYDIFLRACMVTLEKYGSRQLSTAIKMGALGNYRYFTNGGEKIRNKLVCMVSPNLLSKFVLDLAGGCSSFDEAVLKAVSVINELSRGQKKELRS